MLFFDTSFALFRDEEDHVLVKLAPQKQLDYTINVPDDHMGGIHWYHPHTHHSTAFQAGSGLAGLILVENSNDGLPEWLEAMKKEFWMMVTVVNGGVLTEYSRVGGDGLKLYDNEVAKTFASTYDLGLIFVNQVAVPFVDLEAGEWYRFRMVFASVEQQLGIKLEAEDVAICEMQLLAKDGIYLNEIPRKITYIHMAAGNRADFAMQCHCGDGVQECWTKFRSEDRQHFNHKYDRQGVTPKAHVGDVLRVKVVGSAQQISPQLDTATVNRPCYLQDLTSTRGQSHTLYLHAEKLDWDGKGLKDMPELPESEEDMRNEALGEVPFNSVVEVHLHGSQDHPFHLHVNPFQIQGYDRTLADELKNYYQNGDWQDTILAPEDNPDITIRFITDKFEGEMVAHCHTLSHEDEGMLGWLWITSGVNGGVC